MVCLQKEMLQRFEYKTCNYFLFEKLLELYLKVCGRKRTNYELVISIPDKRKYKTDENR